MRQSLLRRRRKGLAVRFLRLDRIAGPTAKRNLGWRQAGAPLIAFTDDDCRPDSTWLERLLEAADGDGTFLQGRTEVDPDERHLLFGLARSKEVPGPVSGSRRATWPIRGHCWSGSDGFDESFSFGGEDTDLGRRALAAGARRRFVAAAMVRHGVLCSPVPESLREAGRWETLPLLVGRHPYQRRHFFLGFFRNRSHFGVLLAAIGAGRLGAATPSSGVGLLPFPIC